ncbi:MAG TPA: hypothetical protein DCE78_00425 [Bacteroidetes bacterium]|nr:hypothetical protein [Bacteroidota bacterium]
MKFILYFLFFYITFRLIRRLLFGPRPTKRVYVNWGTNTTNESPFGFNNQRHTDESTNTSEPRVGQFGRNNGPSVEPKKLNNVEDADFEEIKS